jgi:hypothetical protein
MIMETIARRRYYVQIIMPGFEVMGWAEPVGLWLDSLNGQATRSLRVYDARVLPFGGIAAPNIQHESVIVNQTDIYLIVLLNEADYDAVYMLKHTAMAITHIGPIICRGEYHSGPEATLVQFFDALNGDFYPVTNADLHISLALSEPLPAHAGLVLLNRRQVQLFYAA